MSEIQASLNGPAPKRKRTRSEAEVSARRAMISSVIIGSIIVHVVALVLFGAWTVAKRFSRPEARFEMKKVVRIPPKTPEHKMNVAQHEAMAPKPTFNDKLVSTRPTDFALPEMPEIDMQQMLPLDPSELISDQVNGLVGSAGMGSGLGDGFGGGGGTGSGMSFFGVRAEGDRILLLFDVSTSAVTKAERSGVPLERIQEETIKLIEGLPISAQFSLIQFTGNYMPFTGELVAATPDNKKAATKWVEEEWVTAGTMSAADRGVVANLYGAIGVLERSFEMRPDVIFLICDADFQYRPDGNAIVDIPYDELRDKIEDLQEQQVKEIPIHD